jgi:hypothetical protein
MRRFGASTRPAPRRSARHHLSRLIASSAAQKHTEVETEHVIVGTLDAEVVDSGEAAELTRRRRLSQAVARLLEKFGMISCAKRRNCSLPPEIVNSTYFVPTLSKISSVLQMSSGVP